MSEIKDSERMDDLITIRRSTETDMPKIKAWLEAELPLELDGNFLCNWNAISWSHENSYLWVYIHKDKPIAFMVEENGSPLIMQVRHECKGMGIGTALFNHLLARLTTSVMIVECAPFDSIGFWEKMGFTKASESSNYAYRIVTQKLELPSAGTPVDVQIKIYPENINWKKGVKPVQIITPEAVQLGDEIFFSESIFFFSNTAHSPNGLLDDAVISISVDGEDIYMDKAKRDTAKALGVVSVDHGFKLNGLHLA